MCATRGHALWRAYVSQLQQRPWLTQAATTGVICGLGDFVAQQFVERRGLGGHYWRRTGSMAAIGFCFTGPVLRGWFNTLDRLFGSTLTARDAVKKMVVDQLLFAPVLFSCLLPLIALSQGMNTQQIMDKVQRDYSSVLLSCYKVWPAAQLINFYFIPLQFRVNYTNIVSLGWNTYLAWLAHK